MSCTEICLSGNYNVRSLNCRRFTGTEFRIHIAGRGANTSYTDLSNCCGICCITSSEVSSPVARDISLLVGLPPRYTAAAACKGCQQGDGCY